MPDYQLSLAIGKEGQNARLAAKLTGCRIDIKSESQASEEERQARDARKSEPARPAAAPDPGVLAQAAEAPEVEVAAPGNGSVPPEPEPQQEASAGH